MTPASSASSSSSSSYAAAAAPSDCRSASPPSSSDSSSSSPYKTINTSKTLLTDTDTRRQEPSATNYIMKKIPFTQRYSLHHHQRQQCRQDELKTYTAAKKTMHCESAYHRTFTAATAGKTRRLSRSRRRGIRRRPGRRRRRRRRRSIHRRRRRSGRSGIHRRNK